MRTVVSWGVPIALAIVALLALSWLVRRTEPRLAFYPYKGEDVTPRSFGIDYTPATIVTSDGERLRVWHLPRADAIARVVYFHGNGGNLSLWTEVFTGLWHQGFDVTAVDYRGYGLSTGTPSEQGLYRDVDATLTFVHEQPPRAGIPLVYWGRSLGAPMAAYAATRRPPDAVVLQAAFPSMRAVLETNPIFWVLSWFSSYRFPTAEWMSSVSRPTLLLHGDRDGVIPYRLGRRLYETLHEPKTFVTIPGGDHNEPVPENPEPYWQAIKAFVTNIRIERP